MKTLGLLYCLLLPVCCQSGISDDCSETVTIDSVEYAVPAEWCGRKLDSTEVADPAKLVRLPEHLCYADYRIYVTPDTRDALTLMAEAALKDSIILIVDSGFRSAGFQNRIIRRRLSEGASIEKTLSMVAPPGYSQHETGRALDFVPSEAAFAHTAIYGWLAEHGWEYGFVETYPDDPESNHPWESWHRYFDSSQISDSIRTSQ